MTLEAFLRGVVAKLEWARKGESELQLRDALAILLQRGGVLDHGYIERWVGELDLDHERGVLLKEAKRGEEA